MGRFHRHLLALLVALAATLSLASCGEGGGADLLPGATASEISSNLKEVRRLADEEDCIGAQDAALEVSDQIDALGGVDQKLKTALREGATRLNEVVAACDEAEPEAEEVTPSLSTEAEEVEEPEKKKPKQEEKEPPGQEKKAEKEAEKEEKEAEEAEEPEVSAEPPTTPAEPATPGGTPPGGIAPGTEAGAE
jgi:outer membrane biosynthesis protein TonB